MLLVKKYEIFHHTSIYSKLFEKLVYGIQASFVDQFICDDMEEKVNILQLFCFIGLRVRNFIKPHVLHVFYVWIMSDLNAIHFLYNNRNYFNLIMFC